MRMCRLYRLWSAVTSENLRRQPEAVFRHLQTCPVCRARHNEEAQLGERLTAAAGMHRRAVPPFLARRIVRSLDNAAPPVRSGRSRALQVMALAVFACAVLVAYRAVPRQDLGPGAADGPAAVLAPAGSGQPPADFASRWVLPAVLPGADGVLGLSRTLEQPFEAEYEAVVRDARAALRFVAESFLPEI